MAARVEAAVQVCARLASALKWGWDGLDGRAAATSAQHCIQATNQAWLMKVMVLRLNIPCTPAPLSRTTHLPWHLCQERVAAAMASEEVALRIATRLKEERAKLEERVMRQVGAAGS